MSTHNYSGQDVIVIFGGSVLINKMSVRIESLVDKLTESIDTDGNLTMVKHAGYKNKRITVTLSQASPSNATLNTYQKLDTLANLIIKDPNGTNLFVYSLASISRVPDSEFGDDVSEREWQFLAEEGFGRIGGN